MTSSTKRKVIQREKEKGENSISERITFSDPVWGGTKKVGVGGLVNREVDVFSGREEGGEKGSGRGWEKI